MEKKKVKKWLPWQTFCYLVAAPNTRNKCRNSWKASRRWRRIGQGSLPWGIRFWACLVEELSPGSGCRGGSKTGCGVKWPGGGRLRPKKRGRPGNSKNATLPARESFFCIFCIFLHVFNFFSHVFCIFLHFFCISQTRSHLFCIFFAFPRLGVIFLAFFLRFPNRQSFFAFFCISFTGFATFTACLILMRKRQENEQC